MSSSQARFKTLCDLPGKVYRQQPGRLTKSVQLDGEDYFVKLHFGVGWREILKNLFQGRLPILGAYTEYVALKKLESIGVPSLTPTEFDQFGLNPATQHSHLVTKALKNMTSLEDLCASWREQNPDIKFKRAVIREVAHIAATIHSHGLNHRDFYICHFLFDEARYKEEQKVKLYLIDLHRAQLRKQVPWRWQIKDIAGLYFSALDIGLTRRDLFCFKNIYSKTQKKRPKFWQIVEKKAWQLYEKTFFKRKCARFKNMIYDPSNEQAFLDDFFAQPDVLMSHGKTLKDDATTTVCVLQEEKIILKRYHVRDVWKGIKRFFKTSRARRSWLQALRLRQLGLATPKPIAMLEKLRWSMLRESYILTEYLEGQDLNHYLEDHPESLNDIALQMKNIFKTLKEIQTAHGDFKATNLRVAQGQIYLLDLDGTKQYVNSKKLEHALLKDRKRFLKNWVNQKECCDFFDQIL